MSMLRSQKTVLVDEFTTPSPVVVRADKPLTEVAEIMGFHQFRHVPVVDEEGRPIGILSDRDLKVVSNFEHMENLRAKDLMSPEPYIVTANTALDEVAMVMSKYKWGSAIVVYPEDDSIGIFTSTDALNALVELLREGLEVKGGSSKEASV